jgi:hypothetical protein
MIAHLHVLSDRENRGASAKAVTPKLLSVGQATAIEIFLQLRIYIPQSVE